MRVRFERLLPAPVERVWTAIAQGGEVALGCGHIRGVVTQWAPPRILAFTWNVHDAGAADSAYPESYLTIVLAPEAGGTRLVLTHRPMVEGFEGPTLMGRHSFLDRLVAVLRVQTPEPLEVAMARNRERYRVDTIPPPPGRTP